MVRRIVGGKVYLILWGREYSRENQEGIHEEEQHVRGEVEGSGDRRSQGYYSRPRLSATSRTRNSYYI